MVDINWDERALSVFLADVDLATLEMLVPQVEQVARDIAPIRARRTTVPPWAKRGYVGVPGRLKASVGSEIGHDLLGYYGDVSALWYGRFLDPPARQLHHVVPFLPSALYFVVQGRVFYL